MDMKNGHTDNERILFHGTDADSVPYINQHGFNRSYAGKNGKEASNLTDQNGVNGSSQVDCSHPGSIAVDGSCVVIVRMTPKRSLVCLTQKETGNLLRTDGVNCRNDEEWLW